MPQAHVCRMPPQAGSHRLRHLWRVDILLAHGARHPGVVPVASVADALALLLRSYSLLIARITFLLQLPPPLELAQVQLHASAHAFCSRVVLAG